MKLELKHIAPYLPYKLQIMGLSQHDSKEPNIITMNFDTCQQVVNEWFKPILRPLSDLTKEIDIEGYFIPLNYLKESPRNTSKLMGWEIEEYIKNINNCPYWIVEYLHEWHFDTQVLIEKGLAIDINTI